MAYENGLTCKVVGQKTRFRSPSNSTAVLNLNCSLVFFSSLSFLFFHRLKEPKCPAHGPSSRSLLGSRCCILQHPSFVIRLPLQAFSAVCRVLRNALRAAIFKKYNCRPTFERSSHNGLHASGLSAVSVTVPVFLDITIVRVKVHDVCQ